MNPEFHRIINTQFESKKNRDLVILDIGCADLRSYSEFLIQISSKYVGIDRNEKLIKSAREKFTDSKIELQLLSIEELQMPKGSLDLIVCNNMLAYTDQNKVLDKAYELLKENGLFVSFNNNTLGYSLHKIFNPYKPWHKELAHSLIVILNTWFFKITGKRFFSAIYNTLPAFKKLLGKRNYKTLYITESQNDLPYKVIDFYYVK